MLLSRRSSIGLARSKRTRIETHVIRFYFHPTPNPAKIALFLEEAGLAYETIPVDTSKGEQHAASFRLINPNGKVPAIVDTDGPGGREVRVFDSTAILIYLAEKTGKLIPKDAFIRIEAEFAPRDKGAPRVKEKYELKERC